MKVDPAVSLGRTSYLGQCCREEMDLFSHPANTAFLLVPQQRFILPTAAPHPVPEPRLGALFCVCPSLCALLLPSQPVPPMFSHLRAAFCTYPSPHWCLCVNQGPTAGYTAVSHLDWETFGLQRGSLGMMQCRRQALQGSGWTQSLHY